MNVVSAYNMSSVGRNFLMLVGFNNGILSPSVTDSILLFSGNFALNTHGVTKKERVNSEGHTSIDSSADFSTRQS